MSIAAVIGLSLLVPGLARAVRRFPPQGRRSPAGLVAAVLVVAGVLGPNGVAAATDPALTDPALTDAPIRVPLTGTGEPDHLTATLSKPQGAGPFPAVVLLHGCGGLRSNGAHWRAFFTRLGMATLVLDSFTARGIKEICTAPGRINGRTRVLDAYAALDTLAAQPFIRADRILVMGFSHGAGIALDAVSERRLRLRGPAPARFRAAMALYPGCGSNQRLADRYRAPVLILSGEADDWSPAEACRTLEQRHPGQISLKVYPEALHAFDIVERPRTVLPHVLNKNSPTGKGATVGGNAAALAAAQTDVTAFVTQQVMP